MELQNSISINMYLMQEKLFRVAGLPMVENCLSGYNSCMFAYGQVGHSGDQTLFWNKLYGKF